MKKEFLILLATALSLDLCAAPAKEPTEAQKKALDVLRETIYQYERRRGSVLPLPTATTNAAIPGPRTNIGVAAKAPPRMATNVPPAAVVQPPPKSPVPAVAAKPPPVRETGTHPSIVELEKQYLDGKITAKQFQKYLKEHEERSPGVAATPPPAAAKPPVQKPPPETRPATPPPATSPEQGTISEVEKKLDEMIRLKQAREQATNASQSATNAATTGPRTKRQKLDDLLKQLIEGKISDAEYKEKREKVINEPEPKEVVK